MTEVTHCAWLLPYYERFMDAYQRSALPHALLLWGNSGNGASQLALALAQGMLCLAKQDKPCMKCAGCKLWQHKTHPDYVYVSSEDGKPIGIDAIRALSKFCAQTATMGAARVVVITPAERMNGYAENALLKVLEEPPSGVYFILVCHQMAKLMPTIHSRTQKYFIAQPDSQAIAEAVASQGKACSLDLIKQCHCDYDRVASAIDDTGYQDAIVTFNQHLEAVITGRQVATSLSKSVEEKYVPDVMIAIVHLTEDWAKQALGLASSNGTSDAMSVPNLTTPLQGRLFGLYQRALELWGLLQYNNSVNKTLLLDDIMIDLRQFYREATS
jgi:DNA polymerase III delta' subunit